MASLIDFTRAHDWEKNSHQTLINTHSTANFARVFMEQTTWPDIGASLRTVFVLN